MGACKHWTQAAAWLSTFGAAAFRVETPKKAFFSQGTIQGFRMIRMYPLLAGFLYIIYIIIYIYIIAIYLDIYCIYIYRLVCSSEE